MCPHSAGRRQYAAEFPGSRPTIPASETQTSAQLPPHSFNVRQDRLRVTQKVYQPPAVSPTHLASPARLVARSRPPVPTMPAPRQRRSCPPDRRAQAPPDSNAACASSLAPPGVAIRPPCGVVPMAASQRITRAVQNTWPNGRCLGRRAAGISRVLSQVSQQQRGARRAMKPRPPAGP